MSASILLCAIHMLWSWMLQKRGIPRMFISAAASTTFDGINCSKTPTIASTIESPVQTRQQKFRRAFHTLHLKRLTALLGMLRMPQRRRSSPILLCPNAAV